MTKRNKKLAAKLKPKSSKPKVKARRKARRNYPTL